MPRTVHVVGAGLAGLAAAVRLAARGTRVIVHEAAGQAGGRCRSYHDPVLDMVIDNGNHLLLSGNRAALRYLEAIGAGAGLAGPPSAEFAFMIGSPAAQGKGLGTRFATMIHAFGFRELTLAQIYASVVPDNVASRRVFEKLGYLADDSPAARAYADEPDDVVLVLARDAFDARFAEALAEIRFAMR